VWPQLMFTQLIATITTTDDCFHHFSVWR